MVRTAFLVMCLLLGFGGCSSDPPPAPPTAAGQYRLGPGDKLNVVVFGNTELSGAYTIDPDGHADLPLLGTMTIGGMTLAQARELIRSRLDREFLVNPRVSVEIVSYRPYYILGEVNHPGNYPYSGDLTVAEAVAIAGGYTRRARSNDFLVTRRDHDHTASYTLSANDLVMPGDMIEVRRRSF